MNRTLIAANIVGTMSARLAAAGWPLADPPSDDDGVVKVDVW